MLRGKPLFFYEGEGTGGTSTPLETPPVSAPASVAEHVAEAATSATEAIEQTGNDGWKTVADELKGLRSDIKELMNRPAQAATPASAPGAVETPPAPANPPAEPEVNVEIPKPQERKVRRNGRKVTRRG